MRGPSEHGALVNCTGLMSEKPALLLLLGGKVEVEPRSVGGEWRKEIEGAGTLFQSPL